MRIKTLEVEEGFLDGLSIEFEPGLNVVIGPRGVGKTSLIELIRFAFGVPGYTERSTNVALAHARSVLGGGRVCVTVERQNEIWSVIRGADDDSPRVVGASHAVKPIVLSQNEVEQIGLEQASRLRLIDGFRSPVSASSGETSALGMVASLTTEIQTVMKSIRNAEDRLAAASDLDRRLMDARDRESAAMASIEALEPDRKRLDELSAESARLEVRRDSLIRIRESVRGWMASITDVGDRVPDLQFPTAGGERSPIETMERAIGQAATQLGDVVTQLTGPIAAVDEATNETEGRMVEVQDESRGLRRRVDALSEGAGQASQEVASLQAQIAQRDALVEEVAELRKKIDELRERRLTFLHDLESARERRSDEREAIADRINEALGPVVRVHVQRSAGVAPYAEAITGLLQGSGLHYNTLAPQLAELVSPREFVEAVEAGDGEALATLTGFAADRAARIVASADKPGLHEVFTARIDDSVEITLLDESVPKPTQELSTGQRCTAVLPILLLHEERVLVLDQPEDHLDNAYVVQTLVRSIRERASEAQTIVATHNANIPVLADASRVILLGSDGKRGFARLAAPLTSPEIVEAISQVMEGGAEAFNLRAEFYANHLK